MATTSNVLLSVAGIEPGSTLAALLEKRADVVDLTQKTYEAALMPDDPGNLSHGERIALACRIAKINDDEAFQRHFEDLLDDRSVDAATARLADIFFAGGGDARLEALIHYVDLVAHDPKNASAGDINRLQAAGISDADIVRLSELIAFASYQIRVAQGLRLMARLP